MVRKGLFPAEPDEKLKMVSFRIEVRQIKGLKRIARANKHTPSQTLRRFLDLEIAKWDVEKKR